MGTRESSDYYFELPQLNIYLIIMLSSLLKID